MNPLKAYFSMTFFAVSILANSASAAESSVYTCSAVGLVKSSTNNPNGIQSIGISIEQQNRTLAGRPVLFLRGSYNINNKVIKFWLNTLGVPEFLGPNKFHVYFTGSFTSTDSQTPANFRLTSTFAKLGSRQAGLNIVNSNLAIPGADASLALKDIRMDCSTPNPSIYVFN